MSDAEVVARLLLGFVFLLAAAETTQVLVTQTTRWHPIMMSSARLREHATLLIALSLAADITVLILLWRLPQAGAETGIALVLTYTVVARNSHATSKSCRCFWKLLNATTRNGLIARNTLLMAILAFVWAGGARRIEPEPSTVLLAALSLSGLAILTHLVDALSARPGTAVTKVDLAESADTRKWEVLESGE